MESHSLEDQLHKSKECLLGDFCNCSFRKLDFLDSNKGSNERIILFLVELLWLRDLVRPVELLKIFYPDFNLNFFYLFSERPSRRNNESPTALTRSLSRSNSTRKKIIPSFEPLSESTESDSLEEQLQKSKEGRIRNHSGHLDHLGQNKPPAAVNIDDMLDEDIGDISSSSEIEIDEPLGKFAAKKISKRVVLKFY